MRSDLRHFYFGWFLLCVAKLTAIAMDTLCIR
jgi:hypothetical protein